MIGSKCDHQQLNRYNTTSISQNYLVIKSYTNWQRINGPYKRNRKNLFEVENYSKIAASFILSGTKKIKELKLHCVSKKTGPLLYFQITLTILVKYQQISVQRISV